MAPPIIPDFSAIKLVEHKTEICINLSKFFDAVLKRESLDIGHGELEKILYSELNVDFSKFKDKLKLVLIESLMYYMTVWPGWQRFEEYHSGNLSRDDWYERFRQYLILKTRFVIKSAWQFVQEVPTTKNVCTQTDADYNNKRNKQYAPYTVCIAGPAPVLNNVVFVKSERNVLVKQYPTKEWQNLKLGELYNWPNISVELELPDVSLSRTIANQIHRYMSLSGDLVVVPEVDYIIHTKKLSATGEQKSFTYDFMKCYFLQLSQTIKKIPGINPERIEELQWLFSEFLKDVLEVDLCEKTMCTNMSVGYNMGRSRYVRSRKMIKSKEMNPIQEIINFYEMVIPQVDFKLCSFNAQQDQSDCANTTFKSLNELEHKLKINQMEAERMKYIINHCIVYKCTACSEVFLGRSAKALVVKHFALVHKGEQSLLCYKCHQEFNVHMLAGTRWKHSCST